MARFQRLFRTACLAATLGLALVPLPSRADEPAKAPAAANPLQGAELIGTGKLTAYRKGMSTLIVVPASALGKPLLWYTEVVGVPTGMVAKDGLEIGSTLIRLERVGETIYIRDLTSQQKRRSGTPAEEWPVTEPPARAGGVEGSPARDPKIRPIDVALSSLETGPVVAALPVAATNPDGSVVLDVTALFANDVAAATARFFISKAGVVPVAVDPARSYIDRVRVFDDNLNIRSHLTFLTTLPAAPAVGPQPVSIVLGHSLVFLPEKPMAQRPSDPRVGFFETRYTEYESDRGTAQGVKSIISRFRLEKANPQAKVSDPIKPITFYLGPGIPQRWKPFIAAGVLKWLPVFEAAGFSNAIKVLEAPTPEQDPNWSPEDVTISVIRWVPEERANATGPHVIDPRSGETLSAHILIWPTVIDFFGQYYWALFGGGVDPEAASLPLSTEKSGALLSYIVAHEVGHSLGLRHNQLASTVYTVAQLRDPKFANQAGPNSSIMAYGRFNYVAQPGDGVTQLWGVPGPYDYAAIRYGYGDYGSDPAAAVQAVAKAADEFSADRRLYWGVAELGEESSRFERDPRIQTENVGVERVEATRLGVANILRSLGRLDAATGGDPVLFASTYFMLLDRQVTLLKSVGKLIAGAMPPLGAGDGTTVRFVTAAEQYAAVAYLLGDGVASLEPYQTPAIVERASPYGGYRVIDQIQASFVGDLINGPNVALLESQHGRDADAYSSLDLGRDVAGAVWGDLQAADFSRRALQRAYIASSRTLLEAWARSGATETAAAGALAAQGVTPTAARLQAESGDDSIYVPWLRGYLPELKSRLEAAARAATGETDRLHFADMAVQVERLLKVGM